MLGQTCRERRQRRRGKGTTGPIITRSFNDRRQWKQLYYAGCGKIDQHNRHRQHLLGLEKWWATQKWQTRVLHSALVGMTVVDAFLMCAAHLPDRGLEDTDGSMGTFITKLVAQMLPPVPIIERTAHTPGSGSSNASTAGVSSASSSSGAPPPPSEPPHLCALKRIGITIMQRGDSAGKKRSLDGRCSVYTRAGRKENEHSTRAPKTTWMCANCPGVCTCGTKTRNCLGEHRMDRDMESFQS